MYRLILYSFFFAILQSSCRQHLKIEANNEPQGYADSQVVGTWKVTALVSHAPYDWNLDGTPETDIYSTWTACDKDNLFVFDGNKTGTYKMNCNSTLPGPWQIYDTQLLQFTPGQMSTYSERIIQMSSNEFKTTRVEIVPGGQTFTITRTWTRQ